MIQAFLQSPSALKTFLNESDSSAYENDIVYIITWFLFCQLALHCQLWWEEGEGASLTLQTAHVHVYSENLMYQVGIQYCR